MSIFGHFITVTNIYRNFRLTPVKKTGHFFFFCPVSEKKIPVRCNNKKNKKNFRLTPVKKTGHFFFSVPFLKKKIRSTAKIKKIPPDDRNI
jgi:hypothetical protein